MKKRLSINFNAFLERHFPERRVFLRSDADTRFIRLRPSTQIIAYIGAASIVTWSIVATSILLMDSIGSGNFRDQAKRDQSAYERRLNELSSERDARAAEALAAQERFNAALSQISIMQSELLSSETRRRELETGIDVIQTTLRKTMKDREAARDQVARLSDGGAGVAANSVSDDAALNFLAAALESTAQERDKVVADAQDALLQAEEMKFDIQVMADKNDQIFRQLEEAMTVSVKPLDKMFRAAGMNTDRILNEVRKGYSGQGGPLMPLSFSTRGSAETA
ncbi:MAG: M23 family peptidase, partial [Rhodobacteraceae bacterium]|nr:M23 family peptidase [Paracoccaceae bacterium]